MSYRPIGVVEAREVPAKTFCAGAAFIEGAPDGVELDGVATSATTNFPGGERGVLFG